jgi:hydrogenase nickel incorporation protein HypB
MRVYLAKELLEANQNNAGENRSLLRASGVLMVNLIGSPGSGKTALLEHTLKKLSGYRTAVIEGDLYTDEDARRLSSWCNQIVQINTEGSCHLEAGYIGHLLAQENLLSAELLFIENIGNLVCPAEFDLGEDIRVVLLSVTEGNDKPRKYPLAFKVADAAVVTKTDLLPYCDFNLNQLNEDLRKINENLALFTVSTKTGEGLGDWCKWLEKLLQRKRSA